jgi:hypothetical protein
MANVITLNVYQINNTIQRRGQVLYSSVDFPVILIFAQETDLIISGVQINSIITIGTTNYYVAETTTQIATAANAGGGSVTIPSTAYASNADAITGGLVVGDLYKSSILQNGSYPILMVK